MPVRAYVHAMAEAFGSGWWALATGQTSFGIRRTYDHYREARQFLLWCMESLGGWMDGWMDGVDR